MGKSPGRQCERLPCPYNTAALLASYAVQSELGSYNLSENLPGYLSEYSFIPDQLQDFEKEVSRLHQQHIGLSPAEAEFCYLNTARTLELYGVELHYAREQGAWCNGRGADQLQLKCCHGSRKKERLHKVREDQAMGETASGDRTKVASSEVASTKQGGMLLESSLLTPKVSGDGEDKKRKTSGGETANCHGSSLGPVHPPGDTIFCWNGAWEVDGGQGEIGFGYLWE
ncbi:UNVERIFIED_CONTAM: hypothetical protein K2H54_018203 [Gekko kuhli]